MSPSVKLVWITKEAESQIVYCARVSNPNSQAEGKSPERLIHYLAKHKHWSPFEMASACIEINTTRDIAAQILRHRSFSFQEFSQRYATVDSLGGVDIPHLRRQDTANRQNSFDDLTPEQTQAYYRRIARLFADADDLYREMVSSGIAKESARKIMPLNSPTRLYMSGTIRSWIHYLQIRTSPDTQLEHRQVAEQILSIFREQLPTIYEALLCPAADQERSTLPLIKQSVSSQPPQSAVTIGSRLKESYRRVVGLIKQYRGLI